MAQNSDPLPYLQLDRAAKPKIIALATLIGTTTQHAQGSLMDFWEICGDPRDLERILEAGGDSVVLPAKDITQRFRLASGKEVDAGDLAAMGLLEPKDGDTYRVRGMSRYFDPIRRRITKRNAGKSGGLASVAARKEAHGTAQPGFGIGSESAQAPAEAPPKQPRSTARSSPEARPEAAPNTADSVQRSSSLETTAGAPGELADRIGAAFRAQRGNAYAWDKGQRDEQAIGVLIGLACDMGLSGRAIDDEIVRRWGIGLRSKFPACNNIRDLPRHWNAFAADQPTAQTPPPKPVVRGMTREELKNQYPDVAE